MYEDYSRNNNTRNGEYSSDESSDDESIYEDDAIIGDIERLKNKRNKANA